jgi:hypothetical protein
MVVFGRLMVFLMLMGRRLEELELEIELLVLELLTVELPEVELPTETLVLTPRIPTSDTYCSNPSMTTFAVFSTKSKTVPLISTFAARLRF